MPTAIRIADVQPRAAFPPELPPVSIFLILGLIQLAVAIFSGGQWASFGQQSFWG
jgi:hypothetical protein